MDIQTRKINLIKYLIGLHDENALEQIEEAINKSKNNTTQPLTTMTQEDLVERAKISNNDYLLGNFKTQQQLEIESKNW